MVRKVISITEDTTMDSILGFVEETIFKYQTKYIVLAFEDDVKEYFREKIVQTIKKHFDVFVILKSGLPEQEQYLEKYFSYGVHGLYLDTDINLRSLGQIRIISFAVELFARGWVFAKSNNNESMIKELLKLKIIPVLTEYDSRLVNFIKSHKYFNEISSNLIKFVPFLEPKQIDYSFTDKIKMKMLLESMNLRQKLMVKNVDESLSSSGL